MQRTLKLLFDRELGQLTRLARMVGLRRLLARRSPRRPVAAPVVERPTTPAPATKGATSSRASRRAWPAEISFLISAGFHALLLAFLAYAWIPSSGAAPEHRGHVSFRIRIAPPPSKPEPPPSVEPVPASVEPTELEPGPEVDEPATPGPDGLSEKKDTVEAEPARGLPVEVSTSLTDLAPPPLPQTIGIGSQPPPLPGSGDGVVRGFSTRGTGKGEALRRHGGGGTTESAVGRGLAWLAAHQDEDGGWSADGFQRHCRGVVPCPGKGFSDFDAGVTALASLAFLGAGHVPKGPGAAEASAYSGHVARALDYLMARQDARGACGAVVESFMYNHALATFALAEAYAMTDSQRYRSSVEAAVAFTASSQQTGGGWDYSARSSDRNDLSITGWQIMALAAASQAGIAVPEHVLPRVQTFLDRAVTPDGQGIYANLGQEAGRRGINMVAVGLLSRLYLDAQPADPRSQRAVKRLLRDPPDWEKAGRWEDTFHSYYYWYTASLALFHVGGEEWRAWEHFLRRAVLPLQSVKVHEAGSWPPEPSWIGLSGGRVYSTAMAVLTFETYYRYEPLSRQRKRS
jgi:hypothetical protein